mgnify:CR=1 FL=1
MQIRIINFNVSYFFVKVLMDSKGAVDVHLNDF